jgi:hypothetical protein
MWEKQAGLSAPQWAGTCPHFQNALMGASGTSTRGRRGTAESPGARCGYCKDFPSSQCGLAGFSPSHSQPTPSCHWQRRSASIACCSDAKRLIIARSGGGKAHCTQAKNKRAKTKASKTKASRNNTANNGQLNLRDWTENTETPDLYERAIVRA